MSDQNTMPRVLEGCLSKLDRSNGKWHVVMSLTAFHASTMEAATLCVVAAAIRGGEASAEEIENDPDAWRVTLHPFE